MEKYICCFCGEEIDSYSGSITSLLVTTDFQKVEDEQESQQFFCHLRCLKKVMKNADYLYIGD